MARAQLESLLQEDPDTLDIRIGLPDPEGATARAVVASADKSRAWREALEPAKERVTAILPDYLALRAAPGSWTLRGAQSNGTTARVIARLGARDGFSAPEPYALALLRNAIAADGAPDRAYLMGDVPENVRALLDDAAVPVEHAEDMDGLGPDELAFNLYRDPAADKAAMQDIIRRWRLPLGLMLVGFVALGTGLHIETAEQRARAAAYQEQAVEIVRRLFVPSGPILDLRRQVGRVIADRQRQRADVTEPDGPFALTHAAAQALDRENVSVQRLQLTHEGVLQLEVEAADFAGLESLTDALSEGRLRARILTSSVEEGSGVTAVIGVSAAGRDGGDP